ncbi:hypothetical protein THAOC_14646, partial [Thalassiosira oceanica]
MRRSGREMESGRDPSKIDAKVASVLVPEECSLCRRNAAVLVFGGPTHEGAVLVFGGPTHEGGWVDLLIWCSGALILQAVKRADPPDVRRNIPDDFNLRRRPGGKRQFGPERGRAELSGLNSTFPLGPICLGDIYAQLQHPCGLGRLGRHNDDRESRAPPWPPLKPVATEVRCGIELSPCCAVCPSGTIYTSFWPNICAGLHAGTSAAPLSVGLPFEFGFTAQTTPPPGAGRRDDLVYKFTFDVANRRSTEARGCGAIRLALGAP